MTEKIYLGRSNSSSHSALSQVRNVVNLKGWELLESLGVYDEEKMLSADVIMLLPPASSAFIPTGKRSPEGLVEVNLGQFTQSRTALNKGRTIAVITAVFSDFFRYRFVQGIIEKDSRLYLEVGLSYVTAFDKEKLATTTNLCSEIALDTKCIRTPKLKLAVARHMLLI